ncbi:uracil-DNA glycosylase [Leucobacter luti]|nr:uracil-DNA glycosylase [Leucobacter luti]
MIGSAAANSGGVDDSALDLAALAAAGRIAPDWAEALAPVQGELTGIAEFLAAEAAAGREVLPARDRIFAAFERPLADVRVLIVGQDPYPTPGHPIGLSFATASEVRPLPRSLQNISRELQTDVGSAPLTHGDLSEWADQGVLLLNRVLTVRAGAAGSHRQRGWEAVTELAIEALVARGGPLVVILWGNDARALAPMLGEVPRIESAHPSPLSASRGFFGSTPFSRANAALMAQGAASIHWGTSPAPDAQLSLWD